MVSEAGGRIPIIAKIERKTAIEKLDEITEAADGLMVARGDLGVEVPLYTVPVLQKKIVAAGRLSGKPVIVATQMLESMVEQPRPTRAEATDVANAVFDGADALMLSGETAAGKYPVLVVETMAQIIQEAEDYARESNEPANRSSRSGHVHARRTFALDPAESDPVGRRALARRHRHRLRRRGLAAGQIGVRRIVAFSQSGFTARLVARYRPPVADHGLHPRRAGGAPGPARLGRAPLRRRAPGGEPGGHRQRGRARAARGEARRAGRSRSSSSWGTRCASAP